jgi:predicted alpha/beta superfamily hydrolase
MKYCSIIIFLFHLFPLCAQNADNQLVAAKIVTIHSNVLNEDRTLYIALPPGYDTMTQRLPVVFVLDAEYRFLPTYGIHAYMRYWNGAPEAILVGITNISRQTRVRDYLPAAYQGNADNFLVFFRQELIPYIDSTCKTNGERMLAGHSHGGVFTLYALLKNPELFRGYVSCDPSVAGLIPAVNELLLSQYAGQRLYVCSSDVGAGVDENVKQAHLNGFNRFKELLEEKKPENLSFKFSHIADDHANSYVQGCSEGLRFIFQP